MSRPEKEVILGGGGGGGGGVAGVRNAERKMYDLSLNPQLILISATI